MTEQDNEALSQIVTKILDEYLSALRDDSDIDNEMVDRLNALLRRGKVPKPEDIASTLFPPTNEGQP